MGVAVSGWRLARAVSTREQLGVVSGTALDVVLARRLQLGDPGGQMEAALNAFPLREIAQRIWDRYYIPGGKKDSAAFKSKPLPSATPSKALTELTIVANFAEVWSAKQGHNGVVGVNLLEKIQVPTLACLYGAMLAGVDYVLMGAGIPRAIPGILCDFAEGRLARMPLAITGGDAATMELDPNDFVGGPLKRPVFLAIVSSASLAQVLARKTQPPVDGFVVEGWTAGGHNAPPRGALALNVDGEPIYGERDVPQMETFRELGLPFWLAGGYGTAERLAEALAEGAQGIQVGTAFAFCEESGILPELKEQAIARSRSGDVKVFTDPKASPTGFPFKVMQVPDSVSEAEVYDSRERVCDLGYLRELYRKTDGSIGYRCAGEPIDDYLAKGGEEAATVGRVCVCNGLAATIGIGQVRKGVSEPMLVTAGDDVCNVSRYLREGASSYSADDVLDTILALR